MELTAYGSIHQTYELEELIPEIVSKHNQTFVEGMNEENTRRMRNQLEKIYEDSSIPSPMKDAVRFDTPNEGIIADKSDQKHKCTFLDGEDVSSYIEVLRTTYEKEEIPDEERFIINIEDKEDAYNMISKGCQPLIHELEELCNFYFNKGMEPEEIVQKYVEDLIDREYIPAETDKNQISGKVADYYPSAEEFLTENVERNLDTEIQQERENRWIETIENNASDEDAIIVGLSHLIDDERTLYGKLSEEHEVLRKPINQI